MARRAVRKAASTTSKPSGGRTTGDPPRQNMPARDLTVGSPYTAGYQGYKVTFNVAGGSRGITLGSPADWFGPLDPLPPAAPAEVRGRVWDLPSGYNLNVPPRAYEPISFQDLRNLAESYDVLRLVLETRKDQMERLRWSIKPRDQSKSSDDDPNCAKAMKFLERPDGEHDFPTWLRMILEDLFVLDAPVIFRQRDRLGRTLSLVPLDGATIKRVIDDWGRTPVPFNDPETGETVIPPAYQQQLKGFPAVDYSASDLIYRPRNPRPHKVYGFSPVEQIIMTINIALRRQLSTLQYYTEGNVPEALIGMPVGFTIQQIKDWQLYWDTMIEGNTAQKRHAKFVPGEIAKSYTATKEPELKNVFDEWLARVTCFAFSINPQPFVMQMNRATAQTAQEAALEEGLEPTMLWAKGLFDAILREDLGFPDLEFVFEEEQEIDPTAQNEILIARVNNGLMSIDEARDEIGYDGFNIADVTDKPMVKTTLGYKLIDAELVGNEPPPAMGGDGFAGTGLANPRAPGLAAPEGKKPAVEEQAAGAKGAKEGSNPSTARKLAEAAHHRLKPIDPNRPAVKEARERYERRAGEILARALKQVREQLPAELDRDAGRRHPEG